ncbi:PAS domain S-box protein [Thioalkalivibrio thiocyanodenitrificans]|uniref:PAS domain S-box protein n=1 Tax=Thioalkalivibrio thiocyanodenitrificans TaxID=243063 RepID=UPI00036E2D6D|nr:PAS domain S-box protein [Thioalkalivibrio thiocyanodenitrificans]
MSAPSKSDAALAQRPPPFGYLTLVLLVAIGYLATALAGGLLALPPGYASPMWPAAGVALAALLMGGLRCWPGVLLGAFVYTLWLDVSVEGALLAAAMAIAATLQALAGALLGRGYLNRRIPLARQRDVLRFLLLAGPLASILGATLGTAALFAFGNTQQPVSLPTQWLVMWSGSSIGAVLFAPLVLLAWPRMQRIWKDSTWRVGLPLAATAALLALGQMGLEHLENARERAALEDYKDEMYRTGLLPVAAAFEVLTSVERFFLSSEEVTRREFTTFNSFLVRRPGIVGIDWAPRVPRERLREFEAMVRAEGLEDYRVFEPDGEDRLGPPASRSEYFPVLFSEPHTVNEAILGLDHGFEGARRVAMEAALGRDHGATIAAVPLLRTEGHVILTFRPVYRQGFDPVNAAVAARREALEGFVVGVFDLDVIFRPLVRAAELHGLGIRVTDITPGETPTIMADTLPPGVEPGWVRDVEVTERRFRAEIQPLSAAGLHGVTAGSQFYYLFSLLAGFLVSFAALAAAGRNAATEAEVTSRTLDLDRELMARRAAESALRASETDLHTTLNSIGDAVLATDTLGHVTRMNPVAEELTGWSLEEARGRPVDKVFVIINERTRKPAEIPVERVLRTEKVQGLANHTVLVARDGTERAVADSAAPITDDDGKVRGVVLVFRDVSRAREAELALESKERELHAILDNLLECVITIDTEGIIKSANPALTRLFGYRVAEVLGKNISLLMPEPDRSRHGEYLARYLRTGERRTLGSTREVTGLHKEGRTLPMELTTNEFRVQDELRFIGALRDISERRRFIDELSRAQMDAEQANRAKSAFLATMSHEIRTPMNGIVGMVDVLEHSRLTPHQAELVKTVRESAASLLTLIDDILDFSKIEAGRLEIEHSPVCIPDLVEGLCNSMVSVAMRQGVDLRLFVSPEIPERVLSDDTRIRQMLYNLIGNAIKFSSGRAERRGLVSVRVEAAQADPLRIAFRIRDNGIGMDEKTQKNLFKPFTQAEISTTRRFGGTGLGLAIVKRLVDTMNGEISVTSAPDEGSAFTVTLPMEPAPEQPERVLPDLGRLQCMLVESPGIDADGLTTYLEHAGATVRRFTREKDAIDEARQMDEPAVLIQYSETCAGTGKGKPAKSPQLRRLLICRGRRRRARMASPGSVTIDGEAMRRQAFLRAVAVAAGRASPEVFHDQEPQRRPGELSDPPTVEQARAAHRLILVAEDDPINQKVILQQLRLLGYAAEVVESGVEALERWHTGDHALILTDLHMPEMDGYALTREIRRQAAGRHRIPIIALTANALRGEAHRARAAGMDEYLTKPVSLEKLRAALEKWLAQSPSDDGDKPPAAKTSPASGDALDISVLERLVGDDPATIRDFLREYGETAERSAAALREAVDKGVPGEIAPVAHKLKSSSRSVGAIALGDLCEKLEHAGKRGDLTAVRRNMEDFETRFAKVIEEIAGLSSD